MEEVPELSEEPQPRGLLVVVQARDELAASGQSLYQISSACHLSSRFFSSVAVAVAVVVVVGGGGGVVGGGCGGGGLVDWWTGGLVDFLYTVCATASPWPGYYGESAARIANSASSGGGARAQSAKCHG